MIQMLNMITIYSPMMLMLSNHPMSMGMILLTQTLMMSLITGLMSNNFWFSYVLSMIMIGGMMILFIYMTSVASNKKFKYSKKVMMLALIMITMTLMIKDKDPFMYHEMLKNTDMMKTMKMSELSMSKYLNTPSSWIMLTMIIYLLMTMIATVKITNIKKGPLRQKV